MASQIHRQLFDCFEYYSTRNKLFSHYLSYQLYSGRNNWIIGKLIVFSIIHIILYKRIWSYKILCIEKNIHFQLRYDV